MNWRMTICNYLLLFLYTTTFVVVMLCSQSSVKHLEIGRLKPKSSSSMSRYMINLYERYKDGELSEESKTTVRSILPMRGKLESRDMLVYNLGNVLTAEKIFQAELHINLRRRKSKPQIYSLELWNLMETSLFPLEVINTNENDIGWIKFNTTKAVHECIQSNTERWCILGVSLEGDNGRGISRPLSVRRMFGSNIQPFLVLFSERVEGNNTRDDYEERLSEIITEALKNDRSKRSIQNNEFPEYPVYEVPNLHSKSSLSKVHERTDSKILSHPPPFLRNRRQRRRKRRKRNHKFHKILHVIRKKEARHENDATINEVDTEDFNICQKRKLVMNFKDFGWDSFIIAPDEIESNYCAGDCRISQKKNYSWTNHAYIQALHHLHGNKIPLPCCSPEKMTSIPILYLDEDLSVILKHFPNAKVEECNCR